MDLWIRNQNKTKLLKADNLKYKHRESGCYVETDDELLGKYKSEERALEVLDEIQTLLLGDVLLFKNFTDIKFIPRDCIVYEMPKE